MAEANNHRLAKYVRWALIIFGLVLLALLVYFFVAYQALRQQQVIDAHEIHFSQILEHHAPLPLTDAGLIRSWMTFDYINKIFGLPASYLQTQLQISDAHYPRLTISSYVKTADLDQATFLTEVENEVRTYVKPGATSTLATSTSV